MSWIAHLGRGYHPLLTCDYYVVGLTLTLEGRDPVFEPTCLYFKLVQALTKATVWSKCGPRFHADKHSDHVSLESNQNFGL